MFGVPLTKQEQAIRRQLTRMEKEIRCDGCRFFQPMQEPEPSRGECRQQSPPVAQIGLGSDVRVVWPIVRIDDWCGQYSVNVDLALKLAEKGGAEETKETKTRKR